MKNKVKIIISLLINIAIIVMEIISFTLKVDTFAPNQFYLFAFYTYDSNIILLISSITIIINEIILLINKKELLNKYVIKFKYISTCLVTLTFLIVIFVLIPLEGFDSLYLQLIEGNKVYLHLLCPIFAIISFLIFESSNEIKFKDTFIAIIPTIIYAVILIILNILKVIEGPYPFLKVYDQSILMSIMWVIMILLITYVICFMLFIIYNLKNKKDA